MKHEAVELLSRYLQIDTTNPPGNEVKGADFFMEIFQKEGIDYKVYEPSSGRCSIRAVITGSGQKGALILLNHIDVVPARDVDWSVHPFSGERKDGFIYGRGALDMKGLAILQLLAFLAVKRQGLKPCRDIIFLAVADEETGGGQGVEYLLNHHPEEFQAELVLNEGGFGIADMFPQRPIFMIATGEKGVCQLRLTRTGHPGHGSTPRGDNALEKMVQALNRVLAVEQAIVVTPLISEYFKQLGAEWEFLQPYVKDGNSETLIEVLTRTGMINVPQISAMLKNTVSLNRMRAGDKINVIPSLAEAEFDIRLLPGVDPDAVIADIKKILADENITVETVKKAWANESAMNTEAFATIKHSFLEHFQDALAIPSLLFGASDSRYFRRRGIPCYGVCPMLISVADLNRIHGIDERISEENMIKGTQVFEDIVKRLCDIK
jgi:acetylornithine deacetylase/succinyl-diaminopimelate desuccinylase-like protein